MMRNYIKVCNLITKMSNLNCKNKSKIIDINPYFMYNYYKIFCFKTIMQRKQVDKIERLQLDRTLNNMRDFTNINRPVKGWIKTIRENLGMTVMQLSKKLGLGASRVTSIELGEVKESISLRTLRKAAEALNCKLFYVLVPEKSLQTMVEEQAKKQIMKNSKNVCQNMKLEGQELDESRMQDFIEVQAEEILHNKISKIWDD